MSIEAAVGGGLFRDGWGYILLLLVLLVLAGGMSLQVLRHPSILSDAMAFAKYAGSDLSASEKAMIIERVERCLEQDRAFCDPGLDLAALSEIVRAPGRHVSQAINEHYGMGVPGLINDRRAGEAARRLDAEPGLSITDAMLDCGFGSKNTFLRAFKKRFGMTPSDYRARS